MTKVQCYEFSPFQENTYIIYDETKQCVVIDPGCYTAREQQVLADYIAARELTPVRLLNTHAHLDHIFGNRFVSEKYGLGVELHEGELPVLQFAPKAAAMYGLAMQESPMPTRFLAVGETISFGNTQLNVLFTPGHSPASVSFYCEAANFVLAGDALFKGSIGRTDLPGGDFETLIASIRSQLFTLPDSVKVYAGHGEATSIGHEKIHNPFLNGTFTEA